MDVDILLDPNVRQAEDFWAEFQSAIQRTAAVTEASDDWMNEDVRTFIARDKREDLFFRSVSANIQIYAGRNLAIYAGDLYWALERKLRRVAHAKERRTSGKDVDLSDAAALIHQIRGNAGTAPLNLHKVQEYNLNTFDVTPDIQALREVARYYFETYGEDGLAEYEWDEEIQAWKWQGQDGTWRKASPSQNE